MKILYNLGRFNGGAPLSILQYAKVAKKNGYKVIAVGEYSSCEEEYNKAGIETREIPCFYFRHPIKNLIGFWKLYRVVRSERPDVIHATSYGIVPSKFISKLTGISTIYSIAGGKDAGKNITQGIFFDEELIVYSQENKEDLIKIGYSEKLIKVISNRLEINYNNINLRKYNTFDNNKINLLLISRLDSGVINSVNYVINLVNNLSKKHKNIKLDIIGDGELKKDTSIKVKKINETLGKNLITVHGYTPYVKQFINESHLIFGKGRSIIESILYNRISFVVGEDKTITKCTPETIKHLYKYNFSGRNNNVIFSHKDLNSLINEIETNDIDAKELEETSNIIDKLYNISFAEKKIINIYKQMKTNNLESKKQKSLMQAIFFICTFYFKKINSFFPIKK